MELLASYLLLIAHSVAKELLQARQRALVEACAGSKGKELDDDEKDDESLYIFIYIIYIYCVRNINKMLRSIVVYISHLRLFEFPLHLDFAS